MDIRGNRSIMTMFYSLMIKIIEKQRFLLGNFHRSSLGKERWNHRKIFLWCSARSNQVRFRLRFNEDLLLIGISELYIGSNCFNACHGHGMCSQLGRCRYNDSFIKRRLNITLSFRCDPGWINNDCSSSSTVFPNEIDILKRGYYTSYGMMENKKCGKVFNNVGIRLRATFFKVILRRFLDMQTRISNKSSRY